VDSNEYVVIENARGEAIRQNATLAKSLSRTNEGAGLDLILMSSKKKSELRAIIKQAYVRDNSEDSPRFKRALRSSMRAKIAVAFAAAECLLDFHNFRSVHGPVKILNIPRIQSATF
jgi:hypothetical protein